jgi:hypothetical protein
MLVLLQEATCLPMLAFTASVDAPNSEARGPETSAWRGSKCRLTISQSGYQHQREVHFSCSHIVSAWYS